MNIHYCLAAENGYHRVIAAHAPTKTLQPAPDAPFITIDEETNAQLYWDVACNPRKYLVDANGYLFVDEDYTEEPPYEAH